MTTTQITPVEAAPTLGEIIATVEAHRAQSTRTTYAHTMRPLHAYYDEQGWAFTPDTGNPAADTALFVEQALRYLRHLANIGRTPSTINKTLAAVKAAVALPHPHLYGALTTPVVRAFMDGIKRELRDHEPRKARALTIPELATLYKGMKTPTPRNLRDRAIIATGIAAALRSSSIALLRLGDVSDALTVEGITLRIRHSKTDQEGHGALITIKRAPDSLLDPVGALRRWVKFYKAMANPTDDAPLFPVIRGAYGIQPNHLADPADTISEILRTRLTQAGITTEEEARAYSSHSLRATFITLSSQAGVAERDISAVSGHRDMTTLRSYDRTGQEAHAQTDYLGG